MAAQDLKAWAAKVERNLHAIFLNTATATRDSIVEGSPITTSPGQPVDTGFLWSQWILEFPNKYEFTVSTNVSYAPAVEAGDRSAYNPAGVERPEELKPLAARREGGPHSVLRTRSNFDRLVEDVTRSTVGA